MVHPSQTDTRGFESPDTSAQPSGFPQQSPPTQNIQRTPLIHQLSYRQRWTHLQGSACRTSLKSTLPKLKKTGSQLTQSTLHHHPIYVSEQLASHTNTSGQKLVINSGNSELSRLLLVEVVPFSQEPPQTPGSFYKCLTE